MSFIILASKRWRRLKVLELCYFGVFFPQRYVSNLITSLEFVSSVKHKKPSTFLSCICYFLFFRFYYICSMTAFRNI